MTIYTADFGNYDKIHEGADIRFDEEHDPLGFDRRGWTSKRKAKAYKMLAPSKKYARVQGDFMWIDSSISINDREGLEKLMGDAEFTVFKHPGRNTLDDEFRAVQLNGLDDERRIDITRELYDHPKYYNVYCGGIFAGRNTKRVADMMLTWWNAIIDGSVRDQLSLPYALDRYPKIDLKVIEDVDIFNNHYFKVNGHR